MDTKEYLNETFLLEEIKQGKELAFEFLFKKYYPRLLGYAVRFVKDEETACDIVQDCCLRFWEKRERFSGISVTSLLFAMVRNGCLDYLRHRMVIEDYKLDYIARQGEEHLYYLDFSINAEHALLYKELEEQVELVISQLPERCREVFIMSRFKGMKNREIAELLSVSTTAVEKHISRALSVFTLHFKEKYPVDAYIIVFAWLIRRLGD